MANVFETSGAKPQLASGLAEGVNTLSNGETVTFTLYAKLVLPLDGYVFWVNAALLTDSALLNISQYNKLLYNNYDERVPPREIIAQGSFHFNSNVQMLEDRQTAFNHTIFTSLVKLDDFNLINPQFMYVASYQGLKFAFNSKDNYYKQADLYHYRGDSLYSVMNTQLIDSMTGFDTNSVIVSNSLPIWLGLNQYFPMYPSYLVDQNLPPPYAVVDITPSSTEALGQFPIVKNILINGGATPSTQETIQQLASDTVKITVYGIRNNEALNFANYVFQYSLNTDNIGIQNMPIIQDEKLTQSEFGIIAMKKTITFKVSYYQNTVNDVAQKLIKEAFISVNAANP
jgi:hypothetical protein